jgi:hypothetical protein
MPACTLLPTVLKASHKLSFMVLKHPSHNPDLVPPDQHLSSPLKDAFRGKHFISDHEMKEAVHVWIVTQQKHFL